MSDLLGLGNDLRIVLGFAKPDHGDLVVEFLFEAGDGAEVVFDLGALLHDALSASRIIPEAGVFRLTVQLGEPRLRLVERQRCLLSSPTDRLMSSTTD